MQKNKNLGIFSLTFSTNSKQICFFELKEIGKNRNSGSFDHFWLSWSPTRRGGGGGGVVECNMTVRCPFLLNTGNRYSLFGEKLHFNTLFGNYQNYQIMDGAEPSHVVISFSAQQNKKSEALAIANFIYKIDWCRLLVKFSLAPSQNQSWDAKQKCSTFSLYWISIFRREQFLFW